MIIDPPARLSRFSEQLLSIAGALVFAGSAAWLCFNERMPIAAALSAALSVALLRGVWRGARAFDTLASVAVLALLAAPVILALAFGAIGFPARLGVAPVVRWSEQPVLFSSLLAAYAALLAGFAWMVKARRRQERRLFR